MTEGITIDLTWEGKPVAALEQIVRARAKLMGTTTQDAVIATAINALVSLRAATSVAKVQRVRKSDIEVKERPDLVPGWKEEKGGKPFRVLRVEGRHGMYLTGTPENLMGGIGRVRYITPKYAKGEKLKAFWASYSTPWKPVVGTQGGKVVQAKVGYFVAEKKDDVANYLLKRVRRRVKRYSKLARNTISVAIGKISRLGNLDGTSWARENAVKNSDIQVNKGGVDSGYCSVRFIDGLDYSIAAFKDGEAGVELALKKAANKMAGRLARFAEDSWGHDGGMSTPFPEVAR